MRDLLCHRGASTERLMDFSSESVVSHLVFWVSSWVACFVSGWVLVFGCVVGFCFGRHLAFCSSPLLQHVGIG